MTRHWTTWRSCVFLVILTTSVVACGGEIVGIGNGGNRIFQGGVLGEVTEALAEHPGTPQVTDEMLSQIFSAILGRATQGDPEAALIVLQVAREQRQEDEG
jgi:hypothetical protein